MYQPEPSRPNPLRPLFGAALYAFTYYILINFIAGFAQMLGRSMVAITVPPLIAASLLGTLAMAVSESRPLWDLGLWWTSRSRRHLLIGIGLGAGSAAVLILVPMAAGISHFEPVRGAYFQWRAAVFTLLLLFCGAAGEEIAFRGFPLQFLIRGYGPWISIVGVGAIFGWLHGFNPGATRLSMANTAGFGVLFGFALLRSHDLWLPIGLHFGWNATLPFLGVELSGFTIQVIRYQLVWKAGDLWSGGAYGPEASLLASAVLVLLFVIIWKMPVHKSRAYLLERDRVEGDPVKDDPEDSPQPVH